MLSISTTGSIFLMVYQLARNAEILSLKNFGIVVMSFKFRFNYLIHCLLLFFPLRRL